jgi:formylglycine-generating enzyme required for sulfatase activity
VRTPPYILGAAALAASSAMAQAPAPALTAAAFAQWQAVHKQAEAGVADLKARTAAKVAAAGPVGAVGAPPIVWRVDGAVAELWDGADYPRMTVVPAGEFTMGSPAAESGRAANEGPQHRVRIGQAFAVGAYPVTYAEFDRFVQETGYVIQSQCQTFQPDGKWDFNEACNWRNIGFDQGPDSPVVGVHWNDAQAYAAWLSKKTGHPYRLLSEAEYEYAERAGTATPFWWGSNAAEACAHANGADLDAKARFPRWTVNACHDGVVYTAPVTALKPNAFGLYGMAGNSWSWIADCWHPSYDGAPSDGSAWTEAGCLSPMIRGGSWAEVAASLRSAERGWNIYNIRFSVNGFRVARSL